MWKRRGLILVCLACVLLSTGCWNRRELNTLGISVGLGIDRSKEMYNVSVQIVNPTQTSSKSADNQAHVALYQQKSKTIMEAMRRVTSVSPRTIYLSHLRILVISEEQARDGIKEVLDYLSRDHEVRADFFVIVSRGVKASELLSVFTQIDTIPAIRMYNMLELSSKFWAPTIGIRMDTLLKEQGNKAGRSSVLSGIGIKGDKEEIKKDVALKRINPPGRLYFSGIAVMKNDKLIGWLEENDNESYSYLVNKVKFSSFEFPCEQGGNVVLEIMKSRAKLKGSFPNGEPAIQAEVNIKADIGETHCPENLLDEQTIKKYEEAAGEKLKAQLEETVKMVQREYQADIFGFGEVFYRRYPKQWRKLEADWEERFRTLPVDIKVKIKINQLGTVNEALNK